MTKTVSNTKTWTRPELTKLGKLADVAGQGTLGGDGMSGNGPGS